MTSRYDRGPLGSIQKEASETISLLRETKKRWEELSQRGTQLPEARTQLPLSSTTSQNAWGALQSLPEVKKLVLSKLELKRLDLQQQLALILAELTKVYTKMRAKVIFFDRAVQDAVAQLGCESLSEQPLFSLAPASYYVDASNETLAMFTRDLFMKQTISGDLATQRDRNVLIAYLAAWLTSPSINFDRIDEISFALSTEESIYEPPQYTSPSSSPVSSRVSSASSSPRSSPTKAKSSSKSSKKK